MQSKVILKSYDAVYKCRNCKKKFSIGKYTEDVAVTMAVDLCTQECSVVRNRVLRRQEVHPCKKGYGIADFIGFK